MAEDHVPVVSCPLGADLLKLLADRLRNGTLIPEASDVPLFQWRIFLPTRRAVRRLRDLLSRGHSMALPAIMPIGDVDEEELAAQRPSISIPEAISHHGLLFEVMALLSDWAEKNRQFALAQDVLSSATRLQHLAQSLVDLLHQAETEERPLTGIEAVYDLDLADHRNAMLDLLDVIAKDLPARLQGEGRIGPSARRNMLIREQADDIRQRGLHRPVVIAGSTGTNPATRDLMAAIARHSKGLVIVPGLTHEMAAGDWLALQPTHPQYNLKILLDTLKLAPDAIPDMAPGLPARRWLLHETMRPADSAEHWVNTLRGKEQLCRDALQGIRLIATPDRHAEAVAIALVLRKAEAEGVSSIGLITPDRDLAERVATELRRWGLEADDTHGAVLPELGKAKLLTHIMDVRLADFSPANLLALLHHPQADFGLPDDVRHRALQLFDMFVLRQPGIGETLAGLTHAFDRATLHRATAHNEDPIKAVTDEAWLDLAAYVSRIVSAFSALATDDKRTLAAHISVLKDCLERVSSKPDDMTTHALALALEELAHESHRLPEISFAECVPLVADRLRRTKMRPQQGASAIGIYGLLEARLMHFDVAVLGGLNEGIWPATPDSGPWLNRPMRNEFQLQQPERDIGLTAHDFVSALSNTDVSITWSARIGAGPAIPSRWILRLGAVMEACGRDPKTHCDTEFIDIAAALDRPVRFQPAAKPKPKVAPQFVPRQFSVTDIEALVRDPYAIFARKILRLKPLRDLDEDPDPGLRGILFHEALKRWNEQQPHGAHAAPLDVLINAGRDAFKPVADDPEVQAFWWPRFVRMAQWISETEPELRHNIQDTHAEVPGSVPLIAGSETFTIRAKADRVDILSGGQVRIIDYKTGNPPSTAQVSSGFSPQLTLEAALIWEGAFLRIGQRSTAEALYIKVSGGREPGQITSLSDGKHGFVIDEKAQEHWTGLQKRLATLLRPDSTYPPRVKPFKAEKPLVYDHLSRFLEWSLTE